MGYIGEEGRVISSNYLFNMLQDLYDKIKVLLSNKADKNHAHSYLPLTGGTIDGTLSLSNHNSFRARHVDGSTDGYDGELYLNYNSPDASIFLGSDGYRIANNGSYYSGTSANADTVDGIHAWQMQTLNSNGDNHGSSWLMQVRHNVDGDGYFKLFCGDGSIGTKVDAAHTSTYSSYTNGLSSTGFGSGTLTYCQTSDGFYGNSGWCHYIIANHGNGETYYNYTIGLPFYDAPMYQRQTGNTSARSGWQKFYTTENITYGTSSLTPGSSVLATGSIYLQYE